MSLNEFRKNLREQALPDDIPTTDEAERQNTLASADLSERMDAQIIKDHLADRQPDDRDNTNRTI
jgi:hypothetical protein